LDFKRLLLIDTGCVFLGLGFGLWFNWIFGFGLGFSNLDFLVFLDFWTLGFSGFWTCFLISINQRYKSIHTGEPAQEHNHPILFYGFYCRNRKFTMPLKGVYARFYSRYHKQAII